MDAPSCATGLLETVGTTSHAAEEAPEFGDRTTRGEESLTESERTLANESEQLGPHSDDQRLVERSGSALDRRTVDLRLLP